MIMASNTFNYSVGFISNQSMLVDESIGEVNLTVGLILADSNSKLCGEVKIGFFVDNSSNITGMSTMQA